MEKPHFDSSLGGAFDVPLELQVMKFTSARVQEIAALTQAVEDPKRQELIFQRLPRHMRRRVMSHNAKRMPRKLREAHTKQLQANGAIQPVRKRPSRKYRRRPNNLLAEYNRRQKKNIWLETHIWHAKRFHMIDRWGYRIAHFPNEKSYRACYRATANHCLLQDISYFGCIELQGPVQNLLNGLACHTTTSAGLTFAAKSFLDGKREGEVMLYKRNQYPKEPIGTVYFTWKPVEAGRNCQRTIWIWIHPAYHQQVVDTFILTFDLEKIDMDIEEKSEKPEGNSSNKHKKTEKVENVEEFKLEVRNVPFDRTPKYTSKCGQVQMILLKDTLNRFRLTGPLSHAVLQESLATCKLKAVSQVESYTENTKQDEGNIPMDIDTIFSSLTKKRPAKQEIVNKPSDELKAYNPSEEWRRHDLTGIEVHHSLWKSLEDVNSPSQLPPHILISLVIKDPRLYIPDKRTKAVPDTNKLWDQMTTDVLTGPSTCINPIWNYEIRDKTTFSKVPTSKVNELRSKLLVPGLLRTFENEELIEDDKYAAPSSLKPEQGFIKMENTTIPVMLIQRPGSQDSSSKRIGFGCGWDVILPAGWGMPFWLACVFRGARPGGLRELNCHLLESCKPGFFDPDSSAGAMEEIRRENEYKDHYFKLPPSKRPNFIKLGIVSPFRCAWKELLRDWAEKETVPNSFHVLRDIKTAKKLKDHVSFQTLWNKEPEGSSAFSTEILRVISSSITDSEFCLIRVRVQAINKGLTDNFSVICIPSPEDVVQLLKSENFVTELLEARHDDNFKETRQGLRANHKRLLARLRRQRVRAKRNKEENLADYNSDGEEDSAKANTHNRSVTDRIVTAQREKMQKLWVADITEPGSVRNSASRQTMGFVTQGDFSFSEAKGCGLGFVAFKSFEKLLETWRGAGVTNKRLKNTCSDLIVLIRSPSSVHYRPARLTLLV